MNSYSISLESGGYGSGMEKGDGFGFEWLHATVQDRNASPCATLNGTLEPATPPFAATRMMAALLWTTGGSLLDREGGKTRLNRGLSQLL